MQQAIEQTAPVRKKALILLNATAGTGKAGTNTWDIVSAFAKAGFEPVIFPIVPGTELDSERILAAYDGKADMVFCGGGDGTLNHVVQGIMQMKKRPLLAYMPAGSTNDFAKGLSIPSGHKRALDVALYGEPFRFDVMQMNDRYFNYVAAFGAFSAISYATDQQLKNVLGHAAYILNAMMEWNKHIRYSCRMWIEADGMEEEGEYLFGALCSTLSVGGFEMFRGVDVQLNDGKMEMLLIRRPKNIADLQNIVQVLRSEFIVFPHKELPFIRIFLGQLRNLLHGLLLIVGKQGIGIAGIAIETGEIPLGLAVGNLAQLPVHNIDE